MVKNSSIVDGSRHLPNGVGAGMCFKLLTMSFSFFQLLLIGGTQTLDNVGVFYSALSVLMVSGVFELGAATVFKQKIAMSISKEKHSNLPLIESAVVFYYAVISLLYFLFVYMSLSTLISNSINDEIILTISLVYSLNLFFMSFVVIREANGGMYSLYVNKCILIIILTPLLYLAIKTNQIMFALIIIPAVNILANVVFFRKSTGALWENLRHIRSVLAQISSGFGFQGRLVASWLLGYCVYQTMVPFVLVTYGEEAAAKLGFTMALVNSVLNLGIMYNNLTFPSLVAKKQQFGRSEGATGLMWVKASGVLVVALFLLMLLILKDMNFEFLPSNRLLSFWGICCLTVAGLCRFLMHVDANYFRASALEKHLPLVFFLCCVTGMSYFLLPLSNVNQHLLIFVAGLMASAVFSDLMVRNDRKY